VNLQSKASFDLQGNYDAFGSVTQTNFPWSLSENYFISAGHKYSPHPYDADNNLTQKTDRKNQTITYVYDAQIRDNAPLSSRRIFGFWSRNLFQFFP
jgi:hypothetical protein